MFSIWLKAHFKMVWWLAFVAASSPGAWLCWSYARGQLGINPFETVLHVSGHSALILLTMALAITPLRRIAWRLSNWLHARFGKRQYDWNGLVKLRRMLGLMCFAYALAHAWLYLAFELSYDWSGAWVEMREKPYLFAGLCALLLLVPPAVTSIRGIAGHSIGKGWTWLYRLPDGVAVLTLLHFWWQTKPGLWSPLPYTVALISVLGWQLMVRFGLLQNWQGSDGTETPERTASRPAGILR